MRRCCCNRLALLSPALLQLGLLQTLLHQVLLLLVLQYQELMRKDLFPLQPQQQPQQQVLMKEGLLLLQLLLQDFLQLPMHLPQRLEVPSVPLLRVHGERVRRIGRASLPLEGSAEAHEEQRQIGGAPLLLQQKRH